jgi:hypothetical protein
VADRIERYLGRLEAELEGRVDGARLDEILFEVEGHLRESEEGWRELGEPDELANRLAVEEFGRHNVASHASLEFQNVREPSGLIGWAWSGLFALLYFIGLSLFAFNSAFQVIFPIAVGVLGWFYIRCFRTQLKSIAIAAVLLFAGLSSHSKLVPYQGDLSKPVLSIDGGQEDKSANWRGIYFFDRQLIEKENQVLTLTATVPDLLARIDRTDFSLAPSYIIPPHYYWDGLSWAVVPGNDSPFVKQAEEWNKKHLGVVGIDAMTVWEYAKLKNDLPKMHQIVETNWIERLPYVLPMWGWCFGTGVVFFYWFGGIGGLLRIVWGKGSRWYMRRRRRVNG